MAILINYNYSTFLTFPKQKKGIYRSQVDLYITKHKRPELRRTLLEALQLIVLILKSFVDMFYLLFDFNINNAIVKPFIDHQLTNVVV